MSDWKANSCYSKSDFTEIALRQYLDEGKEGKRICFQ